MFLPHTLPPKHHDLDKSKYASAMHDSRKEPLPCAWMISYPTNTKAC